MLESVHIPDSAAPHAPVSARAVRRHAPAGDDRHGADCRTRDTAGRRAQHRARCHGAGADPEPVPGTACPHRHRDRAGDARPGGNRRSGRPGRGDVCRAHHGAGTGARVVRPPAPPVHRSTAAIDSAHRCPSAGAPGEHRRHAAERGGVAGRLRIRPALHLPDGGVRHHRPAAASKPGRGTGRRAITRARWANCAARPHEQRADHAHAARRRGVSQQRCRLRTADCQAAVGQLSRRLRTRPCAAARGQRRQLRSGARGNPGAGGRIGQRQIDHRPRPAAPGAGRFRASRCFTAPTCCSSPGRACTRCAAICS